MIYSTRRVWSLLGKQERYKFSLLVLGRCVSGFLDVAGVLLIGVITAYSAAIAESQTNSQPINFLNISLPSANIHTVIYLVIGMIVIFLSKSTLGVLLTRATAHHIADIEVRNSKNILKSALYGRLDQLREHSKSEFLYSTGIGIQATFSGILNPLATIIAELSLLVLICIAFFVVNPVIAVFTLVYFFVLAFTIQFVVGKTAKRAGIETTEGSVGVNQVVSDSIDAYKEIHVYKKQTYFINKLYFQRNKMAHSAATGTFVGGLPRYIIETALIFGIVLLVGQQISTVGLTAAMVVVGIFLAGGMRIMASMLPLQTSFLSIRLASSQSEKVLDLLYEIKESDSLPTENTEINANLNGKIQGVGISINKLEYSHPGSKIPALSEISLQILPGQFVAFIGPSGAGKTTLADVILGLITPSSGHVAFFSDEKLSTRTNLQIGYVPQKPGMVAGTIKENIALGVPDEEIDFELLRKVIQDAHLSEIIDEFPEGIEKSLGSQQHALSGGQLQRIGLARALYTKPDLLVLDEATSALDADSESVVSQSIEKMRGKTTVLVIAHRLSTIQNADRVFVMENGGVVAQGSLQELISTSELVSGFVQKMKIDDSNS